jgi:hypothetical protein
MMVRIPCPSLENMSGEIRSNRPYSSFGIWLYHFNSVKHILIPFFYYYDIKCSRKWKVLLPQELVEEILFMSVTTNQYIRLNL